MHWADPSRLGRPYSKDPSVIRFRGRYLLYYSMPTQDTNGALSAWAVGVAESRNLTAWRKVAEILPEQDCERKGLAAPCAKVIGGRVHLFYQTYGNGPADAICHAVSDDGLRFTRDPSNPVFHPTGAWTAGRAIDAEIVEFKNRWFLYAATRDPAMKIQMLTGAVAERSAGFSRTAWRQLIDASILKPELPWEQDCIEAPSCLVRDGAMYMFYAGAYNNAPQQIGCARSRDGIHFERLFREPLLPCGQPGSWNSSESGHPGVFLDDDGQTYLFFQGNSDKGRTWYLSFVKIGWRNGLPFIQK
jgi:sucrose-6-phosphate hydrolase SacC (GH32 family)